ncbi:hypothetical protein JTB14_038475 [Gonioctena quinquepunctata]|nr:hypothetical protein JTB14_038475 [Gonioctena quinquepunctata]
MYIFRKASSFIEENSQFFVDKNLHIYTSVQTVGRISYTNDSILLESLSDNKRIQLNVMSEVIPNDGIYVHLFGTFSYFSNRSKTEWYNFEGENDEFIVVLDLQFWNEVDNESQARRLEDLICSINNTLMQN